MSYTSVLDRPDSHQPRAFKLQEENSEQVKGEITEQKLIDGMVAQLKQLRKMKKLTQADIAALSGLHYQNISRLERGCVAPNLKTLCRYANALGCSFVLVCLQD